MTPQIELRSDLNAEDDDGQNWTLLENATNPARVHVGAVLSRERLDSGRSFASRRWTPTGRSTSSNSTRATRPRANCSPQWHNARSINAYLRPDEFAPKIKRRATRPPRTNPLSSLAGRILPLLERLRLARWDLSRQRGGLLIVTRHHCHPKAVARQRCQRGLRPRPAGSLGLPISLEPCWLRSARRHPRGSEDLLANRRQSSKAYLNCKNCSDRCQQPQAYEK